MYINTITLDSLKASLLEVLHINDQELDELLGTCYNKFQKDHQVFILDNQYDYFFEYAKKHLCKEIDQVIFIHISRRLDKGNMSYSLKDVLVKDTSLSLFLKKYDITFQFDDKMKMYVDGREITFNDGNYIERYLRQRFTLDYDLKGFVFGDAIDKEPYEYAPEILGYLDTYVDMMDDFIKNSICYEFIYLLPLHDIYFEEYEELSFKDKQYHLIVKALQRLYFYKYDKDFVQEEECYIGLNEDCVLDEKSMIQKQCLNI